MYWCSNNTAKSIDTHIHTGVQVTAYVCVYAAFQTGTRLYYGRTGQYFLPQSIIIQIDNANYYKNERVYPFEFQRVRCINVRVMSAVARNVAVN